MVKCVMGAAPSNSGVIHDMLAHKQVLLECSGSTGGEGTPECVKFEVDMCLFGRND